MKRKLLAGAMGVLLMASMVMPVVAATDPNTTTLTTTKGSTYSLKIPIATKDIPYGALYTDLGSLTVTGNVGIGESVTVSTKINQLVRTGNAEDTISFSLVDVTNPDAPKIFTSSVWREEELFDESKSIPLSVQIPTVNWENAKAGDYTGSIVFTASVNNPQQVQ